MSADSSVSANITSIVALLNSNNVNNITDIKYVPDSNMIFISIPSSDVSSTAEKGKISTRQINIIKKQISDKFQIAAEFIIFIDQNHKKIEDGLNVLLKGKYSEFNVEAIISFISYNRADIWVNGDDNKMTQQLFSKISQDIKIYLTIFNISINNIFKNVSEKVTPSSVVIIKIIKKYSPVTLQNIMSKLNDLNYFIPSHDWISSQLDTLRKKGYVIWQENNTYVLTHKGIDVLPSLKSPQSSDIDRILEIGRKKW